MTQGNEQHVANAPIQPTPKAKHGVKLHGYKLEYLADPKGKDFLMLSWAKAGPKDVAFCANEEQFIEVMRALYARLATRAHSRAAEAAEETSRVSNEA